MHISYGKLSILHTVGVWIYILSNQWIYIAHTTVWMVSVRLKHSMRDSVALRHAVAQYARQGPIQLARSITVAQQAFSAGNLWDGYVVLMRPLVFRTFQIRAMILSSRLYFMISSAPHESQDPGIQAAESLGPADLRKKWCVN